MKVILGISAYYHDAAAAILVDGNVVAAAQEERFTRVKHTADFPINAVKYCLEHTGFTIDELDAVIFYEKPFVKFERILETYYAFAPNGVLSFLKAIPVWIGEKLFLKKKIREALSEVEKYDTRKLKLLFSEHHLSHAASAFFASPFEEAAILTIDGVGEWSTATIGHGKNNQITMISEMRFPHSIGLLYSAFTYFLGFKVNSGEYKLMGLAPYGIADSEQTIKFIEIIKDKLVTINDDGSIWLNQKYFNYATGLKMLNKHQWKSLFGIDPRETEELTQAHANLALAIQSITEEIVIKLANTAKCLTNSDSICLAGGVALNCVANSKLQSANIFKNIYIQPAAGDAGGALGAAYIANYIYFGEERKIAQEKDAMQGTYLGPEFSDQQILSVCKKYKAVYHHCTLEGELNNTISEYLADGKVVGWFQGRMEFGPRALGNRSILADARNLEMQQKLNVKIKNREGFRPFAPSVMSEDFTEYFAMDKPSPYMLFTAFVNPNRRSNLPPTYDTLSMMEKLNYGRSDLPAITHLDFSARVQTVDKTTNGKFWNLLNAFKKKTGYSVLINTSFNRRGEPMVCSPMDAYCCFMATGMDYLVMNEFIFTKTEQPDWNNEHKWAVDWTLD